MNDRVSFFLFTNDSSSLFSVPDIDESDGERAMSFDNREEISANDIASALVTLKKQHRLSIKFVDDIICLLKTLGVRNTPSSWHKVKRLLSESRPASDHYFLCPTCSQQTLNEKRCTNCATVHTCKLPSLHSFSVTEQIQNILINNSDIDLLYDAKSPALQDIRDGGVYRSIRRTNSDRVLTLTLNIDGVQPSRNAKSTIWPILLAINELPPKRRFSLENIILGGVWSAKAKPSRDHAKLLLKPLIDELLNLEQGHRFALSDGNYHAVHVYLIAACCDKPAQVLVQCIPEPIAAFGCGRCEVEGERFLFHPRFTVDPLIGFVVATDNRGHVRSFSLTHQDFDTIHHRSNERYDALLDLLQLQKHLRALAPPAQRKKIAIRDKKLRRASLESVFSDSLLISMSADLLWLTACITSILAHL